MSAAAQAIVAPGRWRAQLDLTFAPTVDRTVLAHRRHSGPLMVQRPFYPEGPVCHVYVLHPPGGVVAGDVLETRVTARAGASVLLTTPASGKLYRSEGAAATQTQTIRVEAAASLEWLPQEMICFDGARARVSTRIELARGARVLAWDLTGLGRPGAGERFCRGRLDQSLAIERDGAPLLVERNIVDPGEALMTAPWGLAGANAYATLLACPAGEDVLAIARVLTEGDDRLSVTLVDGILVARFLGNGLAPPRSALERLWRALRPLVLGREPVAPRVWAT